LPLPLNIDAEITLRLWDHGGSGPPVLFLHGYMDTGRSFDAVAEDLQGDVRCLCLDWRGHGESDHAPPGASYHLLDHLKDLARVLGRLDEQELEPAALVGHSMGGNLALMLAGSWPERVRRLLLLDFMGPPSEDARKQPERLGRLLSSLGTPKSLETVSSFEAGIERLMKTNRSLSRAGAERMAAHAIVTDEDDPSAFRFAFDPRLRGPNPIRYPEEMWQTLFGRITARVRILRGEHGYVSVDERNRSRIERLADGAMRTVAGVGHQLHVERPDEVAAAVRSLLEP
jgi:pimeloyl-ACP methyl ester carboxylesterase